MRVAAFAFVLLVAAALAPPALAQGHSPVLGEGFSTYGNFTANFTSEGLWIKTGPPRDFPLRFVLRENATGEPARGLAAPRLVVDWFPSNGDEMQTWRLDATEFPNGTYGADFTFPAAGHFHVAFTANHPDLTYVGPGMINIDEPPRPAKSPVPGTTLGLVLAALAGALALGRGRR